MNKWYKHIVDEYGIDYWCYRIELVYNSFYNYTEILHVYVDSDSGKCYLSTSFKPIEYVHPNNVPENIKKQILEHIEDPMFEIEVEKFIQEYDLKRDWWNYELR